MAKAGGLPNSMQARDQKYIVNQHWLYTNEILATYLSCN